MCLCNCFKDLIFNFFFECGFRKFVARRAIVEELAALGATVHTCAPNESDLIKCLKDWKGNDECFQVSGSDQIFSS